MTGPLNGFPRRTWRAGRVLWRIHHATLDPWWFSFDGSGRFDPVDATGMGACYLAADPLGSWVEVFRTRLELDEADVKARSLASVRFMRGLRLANVTSRRALGFGVTAEIGAGGEYDESHRFASQAAQAGFDGVLYWVKHDPRQNLVGVALFGPAGAPSKATPPLPAAYIGDIDDELIDQARRSFGYRVLPRP